MESKKRTYGRQWTVTQSMFDETALGWCRRCGSVVDDCGSCSVAVGADENGNSITKGIPNNWKEKEATMEKKMTQTEAAKYLGMNQEYLSRLGRKGKGPNFTKSGNYRNAPCFYTKSDLDAWAKEYGWERNAAKRKAKRTAPAPKPPMDNVQPMVTTTAPEPCTGDHSAVVDAIAPTDDDKTRLSMRIANHVFAGVPLTEAVARAIAELLEME